MEMLTPEVTESIRKSAELNRTPFYIVFEKILKDNYNFLKNCFSVLPNTRIYYSLKTNYESQILLTLMNLGVKAEVCGELDMVLAHKAGFSKEDIIFDACYKTDEDIATALRWGIHLFNVESLDEIINLNNIAGRLHTKARIGLRVDLGWRSFKPINIFMSRLQKKFGFKVGDIHRVVSFLGDKNNVELCGLMTHNNTPKKSPRDYARSVKMLFCLALQLRKKNIQINEINIGGGFPCLSSKPAMKRIADAIIKEYNRCSHANEFYPELVIEPGRVLVDNAVMLVGKIIRIENNRAFYDVSINDLGYRFPFKENDFLVINVGTQAQTRRITSIYGPTLNPYDKLLFFRKNSLRIEAGDLLVILDAGAYTISRSTQFTKPRSAVLFVNTKGEEKIIRHKETPDDVLASQEWN